MHVIIADTPNPLSKRQRVFFQYFTFILIDLTVLNLFQEHSQYLTIESFSISLLAAILLQAMLKLTIYVEQRVADYFKSKTGFIAKLRPLSAWAILFVSKLLILEAVNLLFGDAVIFGGLYQGLVTFLIVITVILATEQLVMKIFRSLA
jgi:hypothetical protein